MAKVTLYWCFCLATVTFFQYCSFLFPLDLSDPASAIRELVKESAPAIVASFLCLPLAILDMLRWSNKFAGPAQRLHQALDQLASDGDVEDLKFRTDDFWRESADAFNIVAARDRELRTDRTVNSDSVPDDAALLA